MRHSLNYLVVAGLMLSVMACKTTKEQEATTSSVTQIELTEPIKIDMRGLRIDTGAVEARVNPVHDSLVMNITKTPCYGRCPVYSADIYESGLVIYNGKRFVDNEGMHRSKVSADDLESMRKMALSIKYFELQDEYDSGVTDLPSTYTTVNINGQRKTIKNRMGGPDELRALENHIQKILDSLTWTPVDDSGR